VKQRKIEVFKENFMKPKFCLLIILVLLISSCTSDEVIKELSVGDIAPDFCVKDLDGNIVILSYFKDQPVILRFWETDCRFCRADTPIINVYFDKYKDRGLKVFYISASTETKSKVLSFIKDLEVAFPVIMDTDAKLADQYNVLLYPQTIMLSPGMKIRAIIPGGVGEAELEELVGPYLTNKTPD